tara:strand:+ start:110 stop:1207 length:1098 start_codon:yes stop_codon:yes gene_type:complete
MDSFLNTIDRYYIDSALFLIISILISYYFIKAFPKLNDKKSTYNRNNIIGSLLVIDLNLIYLLAFKSNYLTDGFSLIFENPFQIVEILKILCGVANFIVLVYFVAKVLPNLDEKKSKLIRKIILATSWFITIMFAYLLSFEKNIFTQSSFLEISKFDDVKNKRYQQVIKNLEDIRNTQLAHKTIKGNFQNNWDSLIKFVEVDSFTITQRRDSSIIDKVLTKRYGGVKTYKDIIIIDTLDAVSVKDSIFGKKVNGKVVVDNRYLTMMYVYWDSKSKNKAIADSITFNLKTGILPEDKNSSKADLDIPVFEVKIEKNVILFDQPEDLVFEENRVRSVEAVNGKFLKIGSMNEVNTNGNWPKNYSKNK